MPKPVPLFLVALDSANVEWMQKWCEEGHLPNLAALMSEGQLLHAREKGVFDEIGSWLTAYSGISQYEHGFYASRRLRHGSYEIEVCDFEKSGVEPLWGLAGAAGLRCAVLDPPEPVLVEGVDGVQLAELNMHFESYARFGTRSEPASFAAEMIDAMGGNPPLKFNRFDENSKYYEEQLDRNLARMARRCEAFRSHLRDNEYDLVLLGFGELHDAAHLLWDLDAEINPDSRATGPIRSCVRTLYQAVDRELGLFLEHAGADATIMILSSYGMKSQFPTAELGEQLLVQLGYRVPQEASGREAGLLNLARMVLPQRVRHGLSKLLSFERQQRLVHDNFTNGSRWDETRAFCIPSLFQNWVRVNLAGREPQGIVALEDYGALLDELEHAFRQITDPVTGEAAISAVLRTVDPEREDPLNSSKPDLVVHWKSANRLLQTVDHPAGRLTQPRPGFNRSSFHRFPGFVLARGPGIERGKHGSCSLVDIAPSCLRAMGLDVPDYMQGRPFVR